MGFSEEEEAGVAVGTFAALPELHYYWPAGRVARREGGVRERGEERDSRRRKGGERENRERKGKVMICLSLPYNIMWVS